LAQFGDLFLTSVPIETTKLFMILLRNAS